MHLRPVKTFLALLLTASLLSPAYGAELETRYATIIYEKDDLLQQFNNRIRLGSLSYLIRNKNSLTLADEVKNKVDALIDRVQTVLQMYPKRIKIKIVLLSTDDEVSNIYKQKYARDVSYISFYAPGDKTVYISVDSLRLHVFAHELGHVVVDHYFVGAAPPPNIHELLAQFVEAHLED
jgi:hypothetical protein